MKMRFSLAKAFLCAWFFIKIGTASANSYVIDPITNYYNITVINNSKLNLNLNAQNLGKTFWVDGNRMYAINEGLSINNPNYSILPANSQRKFAIEVKNFNQGYLVFSPLDTSGTRFQIIQTNNPTGQNPKNCFSTQALPRFLCVEDISQTNSLAKVKLGYVTHIDSMTSGTSIDFSIIINPN